jgi:hypothetical protein
MAAKILVTIEHEKQRELAGKYLEHVGAAKGLKL